MKSHDLGLPTVNDEARRVGTAERHRCAVCNILSLSVEDYQQALSIVNQYISVHKDKDLMQ